MEHLSQQPRLGTCNDYDLRTNKIRSITIEFGNKDAVLEGSGITDAFANNLDDIICNPAGPLSAVKKGIEALIGRTDGINVEFTRPAI